MTRILGISVKLEHFTKQVVDFLSRHPILLLTSWDLYRMVGDLLAGKKAKEDFFKLLHGENGVLDYQ